MLSRGRRWGLRLRVGAVVSGSVGRRVINDVLIRRDGRPAGADNAPFMGYRALHGVSRPSWGLDTLHGLSHGRWGCG